VFSWGVFAEKKMTGHPVYLLLANFEVENDFTTFGPGFKGPDYWIVYKCLLFHFYSCQ